ncbi:unnamed protein product [Effrenium voratum]|uniref:VOC domain-containing protein n=1 Tax=Effrenium voratum TaxID=2562239 RepID=A0AA36JGN7_9DINO|nr:unnamed protein product [Effrenium voratum]CAJ1405880.1 unnamed protein product [Effrenium voratum]CAJ1426657.1 unnamed protein product [Effrenium voratum]
MGIMASALHMMENVMGKVMQSLLMPKVAPDWFAGTRRLTEFPQAPAESLLLLGFVTLQVPDVEAAMRFFVKGLGAKEGPEVGGAKTVCLGASQLRLRPGGDAVWPGNFYLWVEDSRKALSSCEELDKSGGSCIQEVFHIKDQSAADAILLQDPVGNSFVVNQAPVGGMAKTMRSVLPGTDQVSNALAVVGITYPIAAGKAGSVVRFYSHFLDAAMSKNKQGYVLNFSLGKALHQTLTFVEEEEAPEPGPLEVCIYVVSMDHLKQAFEKCSEAGITDGSWEDAEKACEFSFSRCVEPASQETVLELRHLIRAPQHPEWPLPRDLPTRASFSESQ